MDDATLWQAFLDGTLPSHAWDHRAHVRIAWMHLERWGFDEAHLRLRVGIIRLNAAHGIEETTRRGYHETISCTWLSMVWSVRSGELTSAAFIEAHPEVLDRNRPLIHYSKERLFSIRARAVFVEPDLVPLESAWSAGG